MRRLILIAITTVGLLTGGCVSVHRKPGKGKVNPPAPVVLPVTPVAPSNKDLNAKVLEAFKGSDTATAKADAMVYAGVYKAMALWTRDPVAFKTGKSVLDTGKAVRETSKLKHGKYPKLTEIVDAKFSAIKDGSAELKDDEAGKALREQYATAFDEMSTACLEASNGL